MKQRLANFLKRFKRDNHASEPIGDALAWWEEVPLALALLAQSYVVGLWYYASIKGAWQAVDLVVAIGAGLALDLIVVTTVMGRRAGRSSGWSWATSLGAFICSALIALDRYGWEARSGLHVAFPLVVFLYSQHLAGAKGKRPSVPSQALLTSLLEQSHKPQATSAQSQCPQGPQVLVERLPQANGHKPQEATATRLVTVAVQADFPCPHCGAALDSKQSKGAATRNGYCKKCKH